jgi:glycosyltransferase involved in cell wall biosynthesis
MRIGIATVQVPFIHGGAESHVKQLARAVEKAGHSVEIITLPFRFSPPEQLKRCADVWAGEDFTHVNGYEMDRVICMRFPSYYLKHPRKVPWVIHQHRACYELWESGLGDPQLESETGRQVRDHIIRLDTESLGACRKVYTVSQCVSGRLLKYNGVRSTPLFHPPPIAEDLYCDQADSYILAPSRLESLKRLDLLIDAMELVNNPLVALIAGEGGQHQSLLKRISAKGLENRVRLVGGVSAQEIPKWYSKCLGVYFGAYLEDYGYITLEAMLSKKPVITCVDSGGPLEFVVDRETGYVVQPNPQAVAHAIDELYRNRSLAVQMGAAGYRRYKDLNISWENVVRTLTAD